MSLATTESGASSAAALQRVQGLIHAGQRFLVTGHMYPDGDVLGSMVALAGVLRRLGKEVVLYNRDGIPERYRFLPLSDEVVDQVPEDVAFDGAFLLDCCDPSRVAEDFAERMAGVPLIAVDHHAGAIGAVDVAYHDSRAAAVGVLIYRLAQALGVAPDKAIAEGIYVSLITDTGSFRYSNTDAECFEVAGELLEAGVNAWNMARHVYENDPLPKLRVLGEVLSQLRLSHEGRVAWMALSSEGLARTGATVDMVDGVVDYGRRVQGVEVACMVRESYRPGVYRISMRSSGSVNVEAIARSLGGGGHRFAAGCHLPGESLEAVVAQLEEAVSRALISQAALP